MNLYEKKRELFLQNHELLSAKQVSEVLGVFLIVRMNDADGYPDIQFNQHGQVYPALQRHLPNLLKYATPWDIVLWLIEPRTVQVRVRAYDISDIDTYVNCGAIDFDALIDNLGEGYEDDVITSTPLALLQSGNVQNFTLFVDDLLFGGSSVPIVSENA